MPYSASSRCTSASDISSYTKIHHNSSLQTKIHHYLLPSTMVDIYEMKTRCDLLQQICPKQTCFSVAAGAVCRQCMCVCTMHCASMFMCNNMHVQGLHCKHVTCTMCNAGTFVHLVKLADAGWSSEAGGCSWWQKPAAWSSCFRLQSAALCTE